MHIRRFPGALAALLLLLAQGSLALAGDAAQSARAYAGLPVEAANTALDPGNRYRATVGTAWDAYQSRIGKPAAAWAQQAIAYQGGTSVFYPFSGPDLVTVAELFPNARRYVLVAIQSARAPVDPAALPAQRRGAFYGKFSAEWQKFGTLGFFRTNDLDADARDQTTRIGVTPILMAFASRLGYEVAGVEPLAFDQATGDYRPADPAAGDAWGSVRLNLLRAGQATTVDYVCLDLSDHHLAAHEPERRWIEHMAASPVLLKAASHLLQNPTFAVLRGALLAHTPLVVQDDTGLDYRDLATIGPVTLYGRFVRVHQLFNRERQRSLAAAYREARAVAPLPFAFGYLKGADQRSLQVARR